MILNLILPQETETEIREDEVEEIDHEAAIDHKGEKSL